jgi:hypothetical protein
VAKRLQLDSGSFFHKNDELIVCFDLGRGASHLITE